VKSSHFCVLLTLCLICPPAFGSGTFTSLGTGKAYSISTDGSTVVGESNGTATKWETAGFTTHSFGFLAGDTKSVARDVSADGSVIVGASGTKIWDPTLGNENSAGYTSIGAFDDAQGVVWSGSGASYSSMTLDGLPGSQNFTGAYGVSADGSVVVGVADQNYNPFNAAANENGNPTDLTYDQTRFLFNNDGTAKPSPSYDPSTHLNDRWRTGVRWDISGTPTIQEVGPTPNINTPPDQTYDPAFDPGEPKTGSGTPVDPWGDFNPRPDYTPGFPSYSDWFFHVPARSTNADGSLVVGWANNSEGTGTSYWDESTGESRQINGIQNTRSWVQRISDNGKYVVGGAWGGGAGGPSDANRAAFRWSETANRQNLPHLTQNPINSSSNYTEMFGVSENGWFTVGAAKEFTYTQIGSFIFIQSQDINAAIWDEIHGTRKLSTFLDNNGVTGFSGWFFKRATDVIYDEVINQLTIIGYGSPSGDSSDTASFSSFHITVDNILSRDDYIPGDADVDGDVDMDDLMILGDNWQGKGFWVDADFNGDGLINAIDLGMMGTNWQTGVAVAAAMSFSEAWASISVPEPASLVLLVGGAVVLTRRNRRFS